MRGDHDEISVHVIYRKDTRTFQVYIYEVYYKEDEKSSVSTVNERMFCF